MHPAMKVARRKVRALKLDFVPVHTLSLKILDGNGHHVYVDLELSQHEDKGRFKVDGLCDESDVYAQVRTALHLQEFSY